MIYMWVLPVGVAAASQAEAEVEIQKVLAGSNVHLVIDTTRDPSLNARSRTIVVPRTREPGYDDHG